MRPSQISLSQDLWGKVPVLCKLTFIPFPSSHCSPSLAETWWTWCNFSWLCGVRDKVSGLGRDVETRNPSRMNTSHLYFHDCLLVLCLTVLVTDLISTHNKPASKKQRAKLLLSPSENCHLGKSQETEYQGITGFNVSKLTRLSCGSQSGCVTSLWQSESCYPAK